MSSFNDKGMKLMANTAQARKRARQAIQMVFQDPLACLNPKMNVGDAIADPLLTRDFTKERLESLIVKFPSDDQILHV